MPLPLLAMGGWAAGSALLAMASKALASQDEADVARLKAEHEKMIYEAQRGGMDRMAAIQQADAALKAAIDQAEDEAGAGIGDYAALGLTAGALGAAGGPLAGKGISKAAQWAGAKFGGKAAQAAAPVAARGVVPVGPVTPAQNIGTGFVRQAPYSSRNAGAGKTYDAVPEGTPQLGYQAPSLSQLGYNPSRLPPSALSAEEASLASRFGTPITPGPTSAFTQPGTGMPPMMVTNMLESQAAQEALRRATMQREYYRRLMSVSGD